MTTIGSKRGEQAIWKERERQSDINPEESSQLTQKHEDKQQQWGNV